jgi:hypothetical protein
MEAVPGPATEEQRIETAAAAARPARRFRLRLGTQLLLVAALAAALAMYGKLIEHLGPDESTVLLLAVVLTGIAVGAWRRASPGQVIAQIGLTCAALLVLIELSSTSLEKYWLILIVAVTIVLPLVARNQAAATQGSRPRRRWVASAGAVLLNIAWNITALLIFVIANNFISNGDLAIPITRQVPPPAALYAPPTPAYAAPVPVYTGPAPAAAPGVVPSSPCPQPAADNNESQEEIP